MISTSHIHCYYGNSVVMAVRVQPGNKQNPGYNTIRTSNGEVTSICLLPWLQHFSIDQ